MRLIFIALLCATLVQCATKPTSAPVYTESAINLVIGLDDLPSGWKVTGPPMYHYEAGISDGALTHFQPISSTSSAGAYMQVGLYKSDEEASYYLENTSDWFPAKFMNMHAIPENWSSLTLHANETWVNCGSESDWSFAARYSNVLVRFAVGDQPPLMTIEQFLDVVKRIDAKLGVKQAK